MAAVFLTTPALQIFLLWRESAITKLLVGLPASEVWVSPMSHAMLRDAFLRAGSLSEGLRRRGLREVDRHRRKMETAGKATYPLPNHEALRIWSEIRGLEVDIPAYSDGVANYPSHSVSPDELLIFATAAAFSKPLIGPAPTDRDTLEYFEDVGITFRGVAPAGSMTEEELLGGLGGLSPPDEGMTEEEVLRSLENLSPPDETP